MSGRQRVPLGPLVGAAGAVLVVVSLCLDWYEDVTGFTVFEALDLVLVGLALFAMAQLAAGLGSRAFGPPASATRSLAVAVTTLVVVASQLVNDPPAVAGGGGPDHAVGIWLALAGAALMVVGALPGVARISFAVDLDGDAAPGRSTGTSPEPRRADPTPAGEAGADPDAPTAVELRPGDA